MADKVQMPSSMGGLVRYSEEYKSKMQIAPGTVIVFVVLIILIEFFLHMYGGGLFG